MSVNINASTTNGLVLTSDTSGELKLQANGADIATVDSSGITMASGKAISGAGAGGKVLQVVHANINNQTNTRSTSYVATSITASITPSSTSSKILIATKFGITSTTTNKWCYVTVYRNNTTNLGSGGGGGVDALANYYSSSGFQWGEASILHLDSPNTTSSTTYTVYLKAEDGTAGFAYAGNAQGYSSIVLMEIAG